MDDRSIFAVAQDPPSTLSAWALDEVFCLFFPKDLFRQSIEVPVIAFRAHVGNQVSGVGELKGASPAFRIFVRV